MACDANATNNFDKLGPSWAKLGNSWPKLTKHSERLVLFNTANNISSESIALCEVYLVEYSL